MKRLAVLVTVLVAAILLAVIADLIFLPTPRFFGWFLEQIESLGPWGPIALVALYVVACLCLLPGSVLTLAAGFLFGMAWGTATASLGVTLGATAAFLVARTLGREWVERRLATHPRFFRIDRAIGGQGFKIVVLTRL